LATAKPQAMLPRECGNTEESTSHSQAQEIQARVSEMSLDQAAQAESLVQLAWHQHPSVGGHRRTPELDAELGVEREANLVTAVASPIGWCPPCQRGALESRVSCAR
jgi:hypothetical protein